jgi:large subunit ribosomal protein L18
LAGKKALGNGAKDAIMYTGTRRYTQRMAAALKGVIDAGVQVPADLETFPSEERINGEHLTVKNEVSKIKSSIDSEVKQK